MIVPRNNPRSGVCFQALVATTSVSEPPPATGSASLTISTVAQDEIVAPAMVWFSLGSFSGFNVSENISTPQTYDPSAHEIFHVWDYDDPGTFATAPNMPTAWNNSGIDYGKKTVHVYDTAGTYAPNVWSVDDEGNVGTDDASIVVQDPAVLYSGSRTICVSNSTPADYTDAPTDAQEVTSIAAARTALAALGQTGRILLRRGETYTENFTIDDDLANVHIGAFGPEADGKPVWQPVRTAANGGTCISVQGGSSGPTTGLDCTIWGIRFQGTWDAAKEVGDWRSTSISFNGWHDNNSSRFSTEWTALIYQCDFDGFNSISPYDGRTDQRVALVDCDITNWSNYGVAGFGNRLEGFKRLAIVGCDVHQKENACVGRQGKLGQHNDHGPFRTAATDEVIISASSFYSANSWFESTGIQSCLRLWTAGAGNTGGFVYNINRVACEGGSNAIILLAPQNSGTEDRPGNCVMDMVLAVGDYVVARGFRLSHGGVTVRNAYVFLPNISSMEANFTGVFSHTRDNSDATNNAAVFRITHTSYLNLNSSAWPHQHDTTGLTNLIFADNVIHQPNIGSPETPDAPVDITQNIAGFTTRNRGRRLSTPTIAAGTISVANNATLVVSYPTGLSASDFLTSGRHSVRVGGDGSSTNTGDRYFSDLGDFTIAFGGSNITITNTSGVTWSGGNSQVKLDQNTISTDTDYGSPSAVPLLRLASGSSALLGGDPGPYTSFLAAVAPGPSETGQDHTGASRASTGRHEGAVQETA